MWGVFVPGGTICIANILTVDIFGWYTMVVVAVVTQIAIAIGTICCTHDTTTDTIPATRAHKQIHWTIVIVVAKRTWMVMMMVIQLAGLTIKWHGAVTAARGVSCIPKATAKRKSMGAQKCGRTEGSQIQLGGVLRSGCKGERTEITTEVWSDQCTQFGAIRARCRQIRTTQIDAESALYLRFPSCITASTNLCSYRSTKVRHLSSKSRLYTELSPNVFSGISHVYHLENKLKHFT